MSVSAETSTCSGQLGAPDEYVSTTVAEHNPLDTEERGIHPLVRFSSHYYNTQAEIDRAVTA